MEGQKIFKIKKIIFTDGCTLENVTATINYGFLIVDQEEAEADTAPSWYNLNYVESLQNVEVLTNQQRKGRVAFI